MGQQHGAASGRAKRFPEKISASVPPGWRAKVEEAAADVGMAPAEWTRYVLRNALEASREARERRSMGGAS